MPGHTLEEKPGCERFPGVKSAGRGGSLAIIGGGGRIRDILGFGAQVDSGLWQEIQ